MWNRFRTTIGPESRKGQEDSTSSTGAQGVGKEANRREHEIACYQKTIDDLKARLKDCQEELVGRAEENQGLRIDRKAAQLTSRSSMMAISSILVREKTERYDVEAKKMAWKAIAIALLSKSDDTRENDEIVAV